MCTRCDCCVFVNGPWLCIELGAGAEREGGHGRAAGRASRKKRVSGESSPPQHRAQSHPETPRRPVPRLGRSVYGEQASAAVENDAFINKKLFGTEKALYCLDFMNSLQSLYKESESSVFSGWEGNTRSLSCHSQKDQPIPSWVSVRTLSVLLHSVTQKLHVSSRTYMLDL